MVLNCWIAIRLKKNKTVQQKAPLVWKVNTFTYVSSFILQCWTKYIGDLIYLLLQKRKLATDIWKKLFHLQSNCYHTNHKFQLHALFSFFCERGSSFLLFTVHISIWHAHENLFSICVKSASHGNKKSSLPLRLSHSCRFSSSQNRYSAALCRWRPSPSYNGGQQKAVF